MQIDADLRVFSGSNICIAKMPSELSGLGINGQFWPGDINSKDELLDMTGLKNSLYLGTASSILSLILVAVENTEKGLRDDLQEFVKLPLSIYILSHFVQSDTLEVDKVLLSCCIYVIALH